MDTNPFKSVNSVLDKPKPGSFLQSYKKSGKYGVGSLKNKFMTNQTNRLNQSVDYKYGASMK